MKRFGVFLSAIVLIFCTSCSFVQNSPKDDSHEESNESKEAVTDNIEHEESNGSTEAVADNVEHEESNESTEAVTEIQNRKKSTSLKSHSRRMI